MQGTVAYFRANGHNNKGNFEQQQSVEEALWSRCHVTPTLDIPLNCVSVENVAAVTNLSARIYLVCNLFLPGVRVPTTAATFLKTKSNALAAFQMPPGLRYK